MVTPVPMSPLDYGVVGLALMVIWKLLDVGKHLFLTKKTGVASPVLPPVPCSHDPLYPERIKRMDASIEDMNRMIAEGKFSCQWNGRDEVRDMLETMRLLVTAVQSNTTEMSGLTAELRRTRNGHG